MRQNSAFFFSLSFLLVFCFFSHNIFARNKSTAEQKVLTGIVLLNDQTPLDFKAYLAGLNASWKLRADSVNIADKTLVFTTPGGALVMLAYLPYPAPADEIGAAARLSWLWPTAQTATSKHKAQVVISVIGPANHPVDLYKIFTQTAACALEATNAAGIFLNGQYLLLSKGYFATAAHNMVQFQTIPLYCWVYFGRPGEGNGFTLGLEEFGLPEMEIENSSRTEAEVHSMLYDAAMSVVKYNTSLQSGQSVTTEEGAKIVVRLAQGPFLEGKQVLRLDY